MNNDRLKFRVFYGGDYSITPYCTIDMNGKVWLDASIMRGDGLGDFDTGIIDITDKCTVEQCTGLRDINGNLIYEGDIVSIDGVGGVVGWLESQSAFCAKSDSNSIYSMDFCEFEIIGNIHEQKEQ